MKTTTIILALALATPASAQIDSNQADPTSVGNRLIRTFELPEDYSFSGRQRYAVERLKDNPNVKGFDLPDDFECGGDADCERKAAELGCFEHDDSPTGIVCYFEWDNEFIDE